LPHEPGNVERRRDDADAIANDLAGKENGIHVGTLLFGALLFNLELGDGVRPKGRTMLANAGLQPRLYDEDE
jgi:hypothetical protein